MKIPWQLGTVLLAGAFGIKAETPPTRLDRFNAVTPAEVRPWQAAARERLFELMMGGAKPARVSLRPEVIRRIDLVANDCRLEELTLQSLPDRRLHAWMGSRVIRMARSVRCWRCTGTEASNGLKACSSFSSANSRTTERSGPGAIREPSTCSST